MLDSKLHTPRHKWSGQLSLWGRRPLRHRQRKNRKSTKRAKSTVSPIRSESIRVQSQALTQLLHPLVRPRTLQMQFLARLRGRGVGAVKKTSFVTHGKILVVSRVQQCKRGISFLRRQAINTNMPRPAYRRAQRGFS